MLEAQDAQSASSALLAPGTPRTAEQLDTAWSQLTLDVGSLQTPKGDLRVKGIFDAYYAWDSLRWETPRADYPKPYAVPADKLSQSLVVYAMQKAIADQLAVQYPKKVISGGTASGGGVLGPVKITGDVPWWYWPLRIGAGIGAGLFIYRVLRPKHLSPQLGEFKSALYNDNGLTYQRWLSAARKSSEYYGYSNKQRAELRKAWRQGEDPAEWI